MEFTIIAAIHKPTMGIGKSNSLVCNIPSELKHFKKITTTTINPNKKNCVIMGHNTFKSIHHIPLCNRLNIVISNTLINNEVIVTSSLQNALSIINNEEIEKVFVIGGEMLYWQAIYDVNCVSLLITEIIDSEKKLTISNFDAFFPSFEDDWIVDNGSDVYEENGLKYRYMSYKKKENKKLISEQLFKSLFKEMCKFRNQELNEEEKYLSLVKEVLDNGEMVIDRTLVGTLSLFGRSLRFNLDDGFPLLTTKRVFWRGVVEELLFFIKGDTYAPHLSEKNIHIWDKNSSREFLDKRGLLDREEGDLGPVYGFQWRHFGAKYESHDVSYEGKGVDQLAECIEMIKSDPVSRRMVVTAWNPLDLDKMALPPCHLLYQFNVRNGEYLDCHMYQRSADMGLGVPFNIASYALLTVMVSVVCGLKPGELMMSFGNVHVYRDHVDALRLQLSRKPRSKPKLLVKRKVDRIEDFVSGDFELIGYDPYPGIVMEMAV